MWKTPGSEFGSTHLKPTDDSGMSGHLGVEGAVLDFRVEDNECHGFLPDGSWKPHATKKSDRISTDCKHSRRTIGAGKRTIKIYLLEAEKLKK